MKKIILFSLLLLNFLILSPNSAQACSCIMPAPPQESMQQSAAVFSGKVSELKETGTGFEVMFDVSQVWKGDLAPQTTLMTARDSAACGYNFEEGKDYLVYAYEEEGNLGTGLCSRTALLADAQEDVSALGDANAPDSNPTETTSGSVSLWVMGVVAAVVIVVGGFLLIRRK